MSLYIGEKELLKTKFTPAQIEVLIEVAKGNEDLYSHSDLHDKLYNLYTSGGPYAGEMPYGIQTGDDDTSDVWLSNRLEQIFKDEID